MRRCWYCDGLLTAENYCEVCGREYDPPDDAPAAQIREEKKGDEKLDIEQNDLKT